MGSMAEKAEMVVMLQWAYWQMFRKDVIRLTNICISYLNDLDAAYELVEFLIRMCRWPTAIPVKNAARSTIWLV